MNNSESNNNNAENCPVFRKEINGTTYIVRVHFNESAKETLQDKILRLIRREIDEI